jgi:hypothetical protein
MLFHARKANYKEDFSVGDIQKMKVTLRGFPEVKDILRIAESENKHRDIIKAVQRAIGE